MFSVQTMNHETGQSQTVSSLNGYSWHDVSNCIMDHVQTMLPQGLGARLQSVLPPNQTQGVRFGTVDVAPPGVYESPRDDADGRTLVHGEPRDALGEEVNAHEAAFAASSTQRLMLCSAAVAASSTQTFPDSPPDDLAAALSSSAASRSAAVAASSAQMPAQVQVDDGDLAEADSDDDDGSDGASLGGRSGDTAGTMTEAEIDAGDLSQVTRRRTEKAQPKYRVAGNLNPWREPAPRNCRKDVGNIGLFMGNWGERSQKMKKGKKGQNSADQRALHDASVMGTPGIITILLEATPAVKEMLERAPAYIAEDSDKPRSRPGGKPDVGNMGERRWFQHWVVMGDEPKGAILMAAKTNECQGIKLLQCSKWIDGTWKETGGKTKTATTRVLVCKFTWKQNIGHLGKHVTVMAVHGHYRTMNMLLTNDEIEGFWTKITQAILEHSVNFLVGDWNMSLQQVVPRLRKCGLRVDLCSWYPWMHNEKGPGGFFFGMDSCAMFYIGGDVVCTMDWDFNKIGDILREAARVPSDGPRSRHDQHPLSRLDRYSGNNVPGQLWDCYKNKKKEKTSSMNLRTKLEGLLQPSTTDERLQQLLLLHQQERTQLQMERHDKIAMGRDPDEEEQDYLPSSAYLKLKQNSTDQREWLLDPSTGAVHNGAHFPLLLFTNNPSARSKAAYDKRKKDLRDKSAARQSRDTPVWLQKGADDALSIVPGGRGRGERSSQGGGQSSHMGSRGRGTSSGRDWNKDWDWCDWGSRWSHDDWQCDEAEEWRGWR